MHMYWYIFLIYTVLQVFCGWVLGRSSLRVAMMKRNLRRLEAVKATDDPLHTYDVIAQCHAVIDACNETRRGIF